MSGAAAYRVTLLQPEDETAVRQLFQEVFGKPLSSELWRWKYLLPDSAATLAWRGEELIAHYGGMARHILYFGEPLLSVQITDVMTKLTGRKAAGRGSPFFLAGSHFQECYGGFGKRFMVGYGFPNLRHFPLAERMGLYASVGGMTESVWDSAGASLPWYISSSRIAPLSTEGQGGAEAQLPRGTLPFANLRAGIDAAWQRQAHDLRGHIVGLKDAAFIERRYLRHPEKRYELRLLRQRLSGRVQGLVVLAHEAEHSLLMDLVGPLDALPLLIAGARRATAEAGRPLLKAWCSSAFAGRFAVQGARQEALPIVIPTNTWTPAPAPELLRDKWWLMAGDTDFL